ncbi:molybdenum ABC transporter ATP-binding protein [Hyphomicrobium sp.]|uniref:molybdenum ABC transporter ATP-binding protein n=1 Tax=Hyphomicrobium sp. TaxID=82 RepID=UPI0025C2848E|nr:molybdenum ABC transporter ATP-binding protein [Hyphomicrobium sp.]MCC7251393.1 molybdenum ABC transporter ATP-binding protein [Hyphomicrobium sp.]
MITFSCRLARPRFVLDVDFTAPGGCTALFGASGSGKTTVARLIAGIERPDRGRIAVDGHVLVDTTAGIWAPVHRRRVGLVFQDGQLLPHLSVRRNLAYGRYFAPADAKGVDFDEVVDLLGIGHLLAAYPPTLSGGERQRVAVGRALLAAPRVLVMDEPLASLDAERKHEILPFIERLRDEVGLPIVYVSHAVEEVARLANLVVRLADGRVIAQGTPAEVFGSRVPETTTDRFEAISFLSGTVVRELPEFAISILAHPAGEIAIPALLGGSAGTVRVAIQATNVALATEKPRHHSVRTVLEGCVSSIAAGAGPSGIVTVELAGGDRLAASVTRHAIADLGLTEGTQVFALVKAVSIDERGVGRFDGGKGSKVRA